MTKTVILSTVAALAVGIVSSASATPAPGPLAIDFRDAQWSGANGQVAFVNGATTITAADPANADALEIVQGGTDGLGIASLDRDDGRGGNDPEEVDSTEVLTIEFMGGVEVDGVWLANVFGNEDGPNPGPERGNLTIFQTGVGSSFFQIKGVDDEGLGEEGYLYVSFGGFIPLEKAEFTAFPYDGNIRNFSNGEYSVVGFTGRSRNVPEPASLALIGAGLLGLGWARRRRG